MSSETKMAIPAGLIIGLNHFLVSPTIELVFEMLIKIFLQNAFCEIKLHSIITAAIFIAQIRKSPDVSKSDRPADNAEDEIDPMRPMFAIRCVHVDLVRLKIRRRFDQTSVFLFSRYRIVVHRSCRSTLTFPKNIRELDAI